MNKHNKKIIFAKQFHECNKLFNNLTYNDQWRYFIMKNVIPKKIVCEIIDIWHIEILEYNQR